MFSLFPDHSTSLSLVYIPIKTHYEHVKADIAIKLLYNNNNSNNNNNKRITKKERKQASKKTKNLADKTLHNT